MNEFDAIHRYFVEPQADREKPSWLIQGIGDDTARLSIHRGYDQSLSIDTLVSGIHFSADDNPRGIGHKALAVGLSDLAASGATPAWASLAITLPVANERWLASFSQGFFDLAKLHGISLVGGDTTKGPLSVTVQVAGWLPAGQGVTRSGAAVGDIIYVSGKLGLAASALSAAQSGLQPFSEWSAKLHFPEPRVGLGRALLGHASAMIDVSDGLLADLGHLLVASHVGASLSAAAIPRARQRIPGVTEGDVLYDALCGGDDYELLFCSAAPPEKIQALATACATSVAPVGMIVAQQELDIDTSRLLETEIDAVHRATKIGGYRHF